ncbi:MAG: DNA polymerase IV, partial [Candidatus Omnitrophota bacterium]
QEKIKSALLALCEKVSDRLRSEILKGRTITLKIRLQGFLTYTRAYTMADGTNHVDDIYMNIKGLYDNFDREMKKVRLIGVKVSNLSPANFKDSLFAENGSEKSEKIHKAVDVIKDKYGSGSIYRAGQSHIL